MSPGSFQCADTSRAYEPCGLVIIDDIRQFWDSVCPVVSKVSMSLWIRDHGIRIDCIMETTTSTHMVFQLTVFYVLN